MWPKPWLFARRDTALPGTLAVLAGLALGVDAWGGFHWDYADVSRGIIGAAPLCFVCEHTALLWLTFTPLRRPAVRPAALQRKLSFLAALCAVSL
jgi:hypothetical protein